MTNKEVIERLKWVEKRISDITYSPESFEALEIAIKALEEKAEWDKLKLLCANEGVVVYKVRGEEE